MSRDIDFQRAKHKLTDNARDAPTQERSDVFNQERASVRNRSEVQPRTAQKQPAVNNGDLLTESNPTELRTDNRQANSSAEPETRGNSDFFSRRRQKHGRGSRSRDIRFPNAAAVINSVSEKQRRRKAAHRSGLQS